MAAGKRAIDRLYYIVEMRDLISKRLGGVERRIGRFNAAMARGTARIRTGAIAGTVAVLGLMAALQPAIAQERALADVATLGVEQTTLERLSAESLRLSSQFGTASTEIVGAAYDIQSAIAGLTGEELVSFTRAAAITAKGTRASTGDITNFFGTMFGIFEQQAKKIGRANWVDMLAGQTAVAVRQFKTTGPAMAASFSALGADATVLGVTMHEQFAVLGNLQASLPGPQAATAFRGFLRGVGKAEKELGVTLTDTRGRLLSMPDVLERLRGRLGGMGAVERAGVIGKAFGGEEAVRFINLLIKNSQKLRKDIVSIGKAGGIAEAEEAARRGTTAFDRLKGSVGATATKFQMTLLKVLNPFFDKMSAGLLIVQDWIARFPNLTKLIGFGVLAVVAFAGALAVLSLLSGVWTIMAAGLALLSWPILLAVAAVALLAAGFLWFRDVPGWVQGAVAGFGPFIGVSLLLIRYWDKVKAAALAFWQQATDGGFVRDFLLMWESISGGAVSAWDAIQERVMAVWERLKSFGRWIATSFVENLQPLLALGGWIGGLVSAVVEGESPSSLATEGARRELPEASARETIQGAAAGARRGGDTHHYHVEKMDPARFGRFMALEGNG